MLCAEKHGPNGSEQHEVLCTRCSGLPCFLHTKISGSPPTQLKLSSINNLSVTYTHVLTEHLPPQNNSHRLPCARQLHTGLEAEDAVLGLCLNLSLVTHSLWQQGEICTSTAWSRHIPIPDSTKGCSQAYINCTDISSDMTSLWTI